MDLEDLRVFRAVVQEGGITRAAEKLNRVQSNVTTRIRQLEGDLGVDLFVREGKRLQLASAGHVLSDYAERLLSLAEEARAAVTENVPRGPLRVGSMESTAATRLPSIMAQFYRRYPEVTLELRTGPTTRMVGEVLTGHLDCALVCAPVHDERLEAQPIFDDELILVAPIDHPPIAGPGDLRNRVLLTFEPGCTYRRVLENWMATEGVIAERVVELSSYHAMLGCAACGMGVALIPKSLLARLQEAGNVSQHRLPAEFGAVKTVLVRRRGPTSGAMAALEAALKGQDVH